jgi:ABC-2 type transport system permease protein
MLTFARHLLRERLTSPGLWWLLALIALLAGWLLLTQIEQFNAARARLAEPSAAFGVTPLVLAPFLGNAKLLVLLTLPLLLGAQVAANPALRPLWLGSKLSNAALAGGFLLSALAVAGVLWAMLALVVTALTLGTTLDVPLTLSALGGLALLLVALTALIVVGSAYAPTPAAALMFGGALLLALALVDLTQLASATDGLWRWLNPLAHYADFVRGRPHWAGVVGAVGSLLIGFALIERRLARLRQGR